MSIRTTRVRPAFRWIGIACCVVLVPAAAHALWDYVEMRRLASAIDELRQRGEPVSPLVIRATRYPSDEAALTAARYYNAAAALAFRDWVKKYPLASLPRNEAIERGRQAIESVAETRADLRRDFRRQRRCGRRVPLSLAQPAPRADAIRAVDKSAASRSPDASGKHASAGPDAVELQSAFAAAERPDAVQQQVLEAAELSWPDKLNELARIAPNRPPDPRPGLDVRWFNQNLPWVYAHDVAPAEARRLALTRAAETVLAIAQPGSGRQRDAAKDTGIEVRFR